MNFQLFNAGLSVNQATLPRGHLLSPASMGNMQKGVIICKHLNLYMHAHCKNDFKKPKRFKLATLDRGPREGGGVGGEVSILKLKTCISTKLQGGELVGHKFVI